MGAASSGEWPCQSSLLPGSGLVWGVDLPEQPHPESGLIEVASLEQRPHLGSGLARAASFRVVALSGERPHRQWPCREQHHGEQRLHHWGCRPCSHHPLFLVGSGLVRDAACPGRILVQSGLVWGVALSGERPCWNGLIQTGLVWSGLLGTGLVGVIIIVSS